MAGAGVARELAQHGVSVALVEKGDFASATTSQSSKLIHGGLRYLELFDFGLVRESLRERETLRRLAAPSSYEPLPFLAADLPRFVAEPDQGPHRAEALRLAHARSHARSAIGFCPRSTRSRSSRRCAPATFAAPATTSTTC